MSPFPVVPFVIFREKKVVKIKNICKSKFSRNEESIIYQFWWGPSDSSLKFSPDFKSRGESEWSHFSGIVHHSRKKIQKKIFCKCGLRPSSLSRLSDCFVLKKIGELVEVRHSHVLSHLFLRKNEGIFVS